MTAIYLCIKPVHLFLIFRCSDDHVHISVTDTDNISTQLGLMQIWMEGQGVTADVRVSASLEFAKKSRLGAYKPE